MQQITRQSLINITTHYHPMMTHLTRRGGLLPACPSASWDRDPHADRWTEKSENITFPRGWLVSSIVKWQNHLHILQAVNACYIKVPVNHDSLKTIVGKYLPPTSERWGKVLFSQVCISPWGVGWRYPGQDQDRVPHAPPPPPRICLGQDTA